MANGEALPPTAKIPVLNLAGHAIHGSPHQSIAVAAVPAPVANHPFVPFG